MDERLSFCPAHSLLAHRGLDSLMRAWLLTCPVLADWRRRTSGMEPAEPRMLDDVPD